MSDKETCTICLDQLFVGEYPIITRLQPCGHYYHSQCIEPWKERSNTCPTCRNEYDIMELIDSNAEVVSSAIADKFEVGSEEESVFESLSDIEEFATFENLTNPVVDRRISLLVSNSNSCILCDSHSGRISACNSCSSTFHSNCLGLGGLTQWVCPICDAEQGNYDRPSQFRRSRNSAITNRVYDSLRHTPVDAPIVTEVVEAAEPMSIEEQHAWESFELARTQQTEELNQEEDNYDCVTGETTDDDVVMEDIVRETSDVPQRFKRPSRNRRQLLQRDARSDIQHMPTNSSTSLVNTIVGQIKEHRSVITHESRTPSRVRPQNVEKFQFMVPQYSPSEISVSSSLSPSLSPRMSNSFSPSNSSMESIVTEIPQSSRVSNKSVWKMSIENNELSLEQKSILQEIVRNKLRPLYKDGVINFDQYTDINKKVSHIIYDCCLHGDGSNLDFEAIAENHVTQEISRL